MDEIKVVAITGAGSGLGASLAKKYAAKGCHVCLLGRTEAKLQGLADTLDGVSSVHEVDVTSKKNVSTVMQTIMTEIGPIDVLINNAGVGIFDIAESISEEAVHRMIDTNLKGSIYCCQEVLPEMKKENRGIIVNIASTAAVEGKMNESVYCASKFGLRGFTESLSVELRDTPIRVFAAYMGGMNTPFWDGINPSDQTEQLMEPDDIADIIIDSVQPRQKLSVDNIVITNKFH